MKYSLRTIIFILCFYHKTLQGSPLDEVSHGVLLDRQGHILWEKNPHMSMVPSSMTKIMTIYLVFEALEKGMIHLDDTLPVSVKAWRQEGSRMFLEPHHRPTVRELIQGIIVSSGNDACIVIADSLGSSHKTFVEKMNEKSAELGTKDTFFSNPNGLPEEQHHSTAWDLGLIAIKTIEDFPSLFKTFYSQKQFTYNRISQENANTLLGNYLGVDGLKTGRTQAGGYGLVFSAMKDNFRLVGVVNGLSSAQKRIQAAQAMLTMGFEKYCLFEPWNPQDTLEPLSWDEARSGQVSLRLESPLSLTWDPKNFLKLSMELFPWPEEAVVEGTVLGKITLQNGSRWAQSHLVANGPEKRAFGIQKLWRRFKRWLFSEPSTQLVQQMWIASLEKELDEKSRQRNQKLAQDTINLHLKTKFPTNSSN